MSDVTTLITNAEEEGFISPESSQIINVPDLGAKIKQGLGISVDDVTASEVFLVSMMPDDSGSIAFAGMEDAVIEGHNEVLGALKESKQSGDILLLTQYLNGDILNPFCLLDNAKEMSRSNYSASKGTPLYDNTVYLLATVLAKTQEFFQENNVPARSATLIISDGEDQHSMAQTADSVRIVIEDMLRQENHIIGAMGIGNDEAYFKKIFKEMGIREEWIMTVDNTASDIRRAFQVFSKSAIQASQTANLSKLGGFVSS
jgi:hypothetical protein